MLGFNAEWELVQISDWDSSEAEWYITSEVPVLLYCVSALMECLLSN